jgi:hypothetical protein
VIVPIFNSVDEDGCGGTEADFTRAVVCSFFCLNNDVRAKKNINI